MNARSASTCSAASAGGRCRWCDEEHDNLYEPSPRFTRPSGRAFVHIQGCGPEMDGCYTVIEWDDVHRPTGLAFYTRTGWMIDYVPWEG